MHLADAMQWLENAKGQLALNVVVIDNCRYHYYPKLGPVVRSNDLLDLIKRAKANETLPTL